MALQYQNPVYPFDFADPFVLKTARGYFAYGTAVSEERLFPVLHSPDLVHWKKLGGSLNRLPGGTSYWAPEVAELNGRYYLFYSAATTASDDSHRLRVAISESPEGPFNDTGRLLLPDAGFTIDASPFRDPVSGKWYLFFATDFELDEPHGTGLAAVKLSDDLLAAVSDPVPLIRAQSDWQIYERNRQYKGRLWTKWHCVEGPHCLYHDGKYFLFFSGGAWYGENYGVGFAVADHPLGPWHVPVIDRPSVLTGIPGKVLGPGHSSCVLGPDGQTQFLAYHAWDPEKTARRMCIDPILWSNGAPRVDGPSTERRQLAVGEPAIA